MTENPWYKSAIGRFRVIAICEALSFLILLFIAMPLKYLADSPGSVKVVGWIHGFLFVIYMISGFNVMNKHNWGMSKTMFAVLASLIPFGPFILDKKILSKEVE